MGKGDMKTRRGKINRGTFGRTRPRKVKVPKVASANPKPKKD
jgi:ribosomal small subunit protein bTHX